MATQYADLTASQKQSFVAQLNGVGLTPDQVPANVTADGTAHVSAEPALSLIPPHPITLKDLAQLKSLAGVADSYFQNGGSDAHIPYPAALPSVLERLANAGRHSLASESISSEQRFLVDAAAHAYVTGNSQKVATSAVPLINTFMFPMQSNVTAAQDLTVNSRFVISGGVLIFGTIAIQAGGSIVIMGNATLKTQVFTVEPGVTGPCIQVLGADGTNGVNGPDTPGQAQIGQPGSQGSTGKQGGNYAPTCIQAPTGGGVGATGAPGGKGTSGNPGGPAPVLTVTASEISGSFLVMTCGGNGGNGGNGGKGQQGGQGGVGVQANGPCPATNGGQGGVGGVGGLGGNGLNGGDGSQVTVVYQTLAAGSTLQTATPVAVGGNKGTGGGGGLAGTAGVPNGTAGTAGVNGQDGSPGVAGKPGSINFIQM